MSDPHREEPPIVHDDAVLDEAQSIEGRPFRLFERLKEADGGILTGPGHVKVMQALEDRLCRVEERIDEMTGRHDDY